MVANSRLCVARRHNTFHNRDQQILEREVTAWEENAMLHLPPWIGGLLLRMPG